MDQKQLEEYLHRKIPLSAAMQVTVRSAGITSVVLAAPLEPNINHMSTVFGGSASALAILAAWSLLHLRLIAEGLHCEVVIQSNRMEYDSPIDGAFTAASALPATADWPLFLKILSRRKRARIEIDSELTYRDAVVGNLTGRFVAFLRE